MGKLIAGLMALALALSGVSAVACPGDKATGGKSETSTPAIPKT